MPPLGPTATSSFMRVGEVDGSVAMPDGLLDDGTFDVGTFVVCGAAADPDDGEVATCGFAVERVAATETRSVCVVGVEASGTIGSAVFVTDVSVPMTCDGAATSGPAGVFVVGSVVTAVTTTVTARVAVEAAGTTFVATLFATSTSGADAPASPLAFTGADATTLSSVCCTGAVAFCRGAAAF
jgi:hypothetical protein